MQDGTDLIDNKRLIWGAVAAITVVAPVLAHIFLPAATAAAALASSVGALGIGCRFARLRPAAPEVPAPPVTDWEELVRRLSIVISARDQGVNGHVLNVEYYALAIADRLQVANPERQAIALAAMLHDIGKLGLPDRILLQDGALPAAEREVVKTHAAFGAAMLAGIALPESVQHIIRHHHENWDGTGYPDRLAGQHIPLLARIVSVADVYDALTTSRAYRGAWTQQRALDHIRAQSGKQFDPLIVNALTAVLCSAEETDRNAGQTIIDCPAKRELGLPSATLSALHAVYAAGLESSLLYELDRVLGGEANIGEMLSRAAQSMQRCLSAPMCAVVTRDPDSDMLRPHWPAGSVGFAAWQRDLIAVSQHVIKTQESWSGDFTLPGRDGKLSGIVIPIERESEVLGALAVIRGSTSSLGLQLDLTLEHVTARIATALDSSLLFDRARHHAFVDPMTGLYNIRYFKNCLDQLCETARTWSPGAGALGSAPGKMTADLGYGLPLDGAERPEANGTGDQSGSDRSISSKRLSDQPLTRRLVRREQTEGAPQRVSGPRLRGSAEQGAEINRFSLLCLDLNNFKPVNDRFGHLEGDRVLRDIADRLRQTAPAGAVVARYGGDEFLIALPGFDGADTAKVVAHIHAGIESYNCGLSDTNGTTIRISVSIGMSVFPNDGTDAATLLSIADQRMFRAKTSRKVTHGETTRAA